jgi:hypothetical protein
MRVVDTSAWIEFLSESVGPSPSSAISAAIAAFPSRIGSPIEAMNLMCDRIDWRANRGQPVRRFCAGTLVRQNYSSPILQVSGAILAECPSASDGRESPPR